MPDIWEGDFYRLNEFLSDKKNLVAIEYRYYVHIRNQIQKYQRELNIYSTALIQFNNMAVEKHRHEKLLTQTLSYKRSILSLIAPSTKMVKKGISEDFFYTYLKKISGFNIYTQYSYGYFYPDLIVVDNEMNICINIEIDEPYSYEEKKPIHFDVQDTDRDNYLIENGFLGCKVLRRSNSKSHS
ncbi:MAG: hypothetical protein H7257_10615 [Taibaiella sp.]|nr:hypothetical protein [Taibaiella sp.]